LKDKELPRMLRTLSTEQVQVQVLVLNLEKKGKVMKRELRKMIP